MGLSKLGLFYAISGFPVVFKSYIGVLLHMVLYFAVNGIDYYMYTYLNVDSEFLRIVHHKLYLLSDAFMVVFNPVLFIGIKFELHNTITLSVAYPFIVALISWIRS
jgi:hypothetical protein